MRYFFDTEFNENVDPVKIISIGVVAEDGREFYAIHEDYVSDDSPHWATCNNWVRQNVRPFLLPDGPNGTAVCLIGGDAAIRERLVEFVSNDPFPEFWAWFGHFDWYLLVRLFGSFGSMPKRWPNASFDVHQFLYHVDLRARDLPRKLEPEHNALVDARWTKAAFDFLTHHDDAIGLKWP